MALPLPELEKGVNHDHLPGALPIAVRARLVPVVVFVAGGSRPAVEEVRVVADFPEVDEAHEHLDASVHDPLDFARVQVAFVGVSLFVGEAAEEYLEKGGIGKYNISFYYPQVISY